VLDRAPWYGGTGGSRADCPIRQVYSDPYQFPRVIPPSLGNVDGNSIATAAIPLPHTFTTSQPRRIPHRDLVNVIST